MSLRVACGLALAAGFLPACRPDHHSALEDVFATPASLTVPPFDGAYASAPPPFTPGIFPCSQCHDGGPIQEDTDPAIPHLTHIEKGLECADCHDDDEGHAAGLLRSGDERR
jgi:hypothetical protein